MVTSENSGCLGKWCFVQRVTMLLGVVGSACTVAVDDGREPVSAPEEIASSSEAILNGAVATSNPRAVVAVYHRMENTSTSAWYARPCSGRVLNPRSPQKAILTARHCITPNSAPNDHRDGPTLSASNLRVSAALRPGPTPPSDAATPCALQAPPTYPANGYLQLEETLDLAIVWVCSSIAGLPTNPIVTGLFLGPTSELPAFASLWHYGYGQGTNGDNTTTGVLRTGSGFDFVQFDEDAGEWGADFYNYKFSKYGTNNAEVFSGDSGGPGILDGVQIGVGHKIQWDVAVSRRTAEFIQGPLGRLYLRPSNQLNRALTRSGTGLQNGASVTSQPSAATIQQWWEFDWYTDSIRVPSSLDGSTCLSTGSTPAAGQLVKANTCVMGAPQQWYMTWEHQIRNVYHDLCMEVRPDTTVVVQACSTAASQKWRWDADSGVAGMH